MTELDTDQTVDATVTHAMPYGAFARLAEGVEGLIHVAGTGRESAAVPACSHASHIFGVRIAAIDRERRGLSLSARLAERTSTVVR